MDILSTLPFIIVLLIAGSLVWWLLRCHKKVHQRFEKIAVAINCTVKTSFLRFPEIQGDYQTIPFRIKYRGRGQYSPPQIRLVMLRKPPFKLSLTKESLGTKISKKIGLAKELQTGISNFDEEFFIQSNNKSRCLSYLSMDSVRDAIKNIYDKNWRLRFTRKRFELEKDLEKDYAFQMNGEEIVERLQEADLLIRSLE